MSEFEKWFMDQDFYTNMRFIHGDALFTKDDDVYCLLPVQMTHVAWVRRSKPILGKLFNFDLLDSLKAEVVKLKAENLRLSGLLKEQKRCFDECSQMVLDLIKERDQLNAEKAGVQKRFNFLLNKNICNESDHASLNLRVVGLLSKWKKDSEHADSVASEDFVQNVLDACIDDLEEALRDEHE